MQAGGERLLKPNEVIPRPELAAVRMAGELKIEARGGCRRRRSRLVREQDARARICRRVLNRTLRIAPLRGSK